jgi:hypothetical protein
VAGSAAATGLASARTTPATMRAMRMRLPWPAPPAEQLLEPVRHEDRADPDAQGQHRDIKVEVHQPSHFRMTDAFLPL